MVNQKSRGTATGTPVYVNGRFLARPMTGVERYAIETLREIDRQIGEQRRNGDDPRWTIVAPPGVARPAGLDNMAFVTVGSLRGHAWEQFDLYRATRRGILVNFCNSGPILHARSITVLHDTLVFRYPQFFRPSYRLWHRFLGRRLSRVSRIVTVSQFSRHELNDVLGIPESSILVAANSAEHMRNIQPDPSIVEQLGLTGRPFLMFVGTPSPNKNLAAAVSAFAEVRRTGAALVLVGASAMSFVQSQFGALPEGVIRTGRISDEQVVGLYQSASALVFPSIYEGFGIPLLEAMMWGCPVIASDIPACREVCGQAAVYFDPHDIGDIRAAMEKALGGELDRNLIKAAADQRLTQFSWRQSAGVVLACVETMAGVA